MLPIKSALDIKKACTVILLLSLLAISGAAIYHNTFQNKFVYDDDAFIVLNENIRTLSPASDDSSQDKAASKPKITKFIKENFADPLIQDKLIYAGQEWLSQDDHFSLKKGYLGSSKPANELKPEERQALEALGKREGGIADNDSPEFSVGKRYGDGYSIKYKDMEFAVRPMTNSRDARAAIESGAIVYSEVEPCTDALYLADTGGNFEKILLLYKEDAPKNFIYSIRSENDKEISIRKNTAGEIEVVSSSGTKLTLSEPVIIDSENKKVSGEWIVGRDIQLCFNDEGLKYPILIDPTWRAASNSMAEPRTWAAAALLPSGKVLVCGGHYGNGGDHYLSSADLYDPLTNAFSSTGNMNIGRMYPTATSLPNGKVLITGGCNATESIATCEIYNPSDGTFATTGSMSSGRVFHTATLLNNGKVLIAGGKYWMNTYIGYGELYDPETGSFTTSGLLTAIRMHHTATLLPNGKVLLAGGDGEWDINSNAELYDPALGSFTATGTMTTRRYFHTSTLLPNGKVLIAGGEPESGVYHRSSELYNPATGSFTASGLMIASRECHSSTLLPNGKVLFVGGVASTVVTTAEIYDPATGSFTTTGSLSTPRGLHNALLLPNGKVFVVGGSSTGVALSSGELYDPSAGTFSYTGNNMPGRRICGHTATLLPTGKVLVTGGYDRDSSADLYNPSSNTWTSTANMTMARYHHSATLLPDGKVLIAGGHAFGYEGGTRKAELYDPIAGSFSSTGDMAGDRYFHTATLLPNGKVMIVGPGAGAELYNPSTSSFTSTGSMSTTRWGHTATLLPNGKVLITGGTAGGGPNLSSAELYNPATGTFEPTGNMTDQRRDHSATLLLNGKVLIAGGYSYVNGTLNSAELYDPATGSFTATGNMTGVREFHTSTLLPNGKVMLAGGFGWIIGSDYLSSVDIYDPDTGTFSSSNPLVITREEHTATLLPNGKVLMAGGTCHLGFSYSYTAELARYTEYDYTAYPLMQPSISTFPSDVSQGTVYTLTGLRFKGTSEASGGNWCGNSPTNYPRIYLQFMDSSADRAYDTRGWLIDVTTSEYPMTNAQWQNADTSLSFRTPSDLQPGYYLLTVMANAVPSEAKIIRYLVLPPYSTRVGAAAGWLWQEVQGGDTVSSGSPEGWLWRPKLLGSGRKVPQGIAPLWIWGSE